METNVEADVIKSLSLVLQLESDILCLAQIWDHSSNNVIIKAVLIANIKIILDGASIVNILDLAEFQARCQRGQF
jgi:hypothetical protein